jgi:ABC-type multidrug transport system ATPase subunit
MAEKTSSLVVTHLSVRRGVLDVLHDVSFEARALEIHGVVGHSGAGKSTLFEAIAGFLPAFGDVAWGGVLLEPEARRDFVFFVPDDERSFSDEKARHVLQFAKRALRASDDVMNDLIKTLSLDDVVPRRMRTLSRGERKRVMIALALLVPRGFVLLDEPLAGLSPSEARVVAELLKRSTHEKRAIVCALEPNAGAQQLCDRFTLLSSGHVVDAGALHELRAHANAHPGATLDEIYVARA